MEWAVKPLLNLAEITEFEPFEKGPYQERYAGISDKIGAKKLGYSITIVPPGKKSCPFHNHHVAEEMFLILEGNGTLRFGDEEYPIKAYDVIACPPGGRDVAHQIINTSNKDLKYFCLGTNESSEICEYPDSNKMLAMAGEPGEGKRRLRHMTRMDENVDYFEGEL